ncbi:MAG: transglutaminase family protein [Verrucomicrobia bacterium]|nr:transglutaminase family protein [Verrucomicrobiota bacterium]
MKPSPAPAVVDSEYLTPAVQRVAARIEARLRAAGVKLTLGGEPTYVPEKPEGAEWQFVAVGPTKLRYAYALAKALVADELPGAVTIFSPGKSYPGEVNPRWVVNLLWNRNGRPILPARAEKNPTQSASGLKALDALARTLARALRLSPRAWLQAREQGARVATARVLPIDYDIDTGRWRTGRWRIPGPARASLPLIPAEGPAGLRLPLGLLPPDALRRALTLERTADGAIHLFLPPLLATPWSELLDICVAALQRCDITEFRLEGYVPADDTGRWCRLGLTADPGVLEVNLPPCETWTDYARWLIQLERAGAKAGLRSFKEIPADAASDEPPAQAGTGGGNHLLFGGPSTDENPFFSRPAWVASLLRFFQAHPCLAYFFTGHYVGASSQAPRPDESARDMFDLDFAYRHLASLPAPTADGWDHRVIIGETLRHLHVDVSGNTHRSEISFDKFWHPGGPSGATAGLIEFRAIESLPRADWMALVALLWQAIAAFTLEHSSPAALVIHGRRLHDAFFLPTPLWADLEAVLGKLARGGLRIPSEGFRAIWAWRFPRLLRAELSEKEFDGVLEIRRGCEGWPLLAETPAEGGATSRFVDTSLERLEFAWFGNNSNNPRAANAKPPRIFVNGRELRLETAGKRPGEFFCGLRYRRTALYPSLHPGIAPHLPLEVALMGSTGKQSAPRIIFQLAAGRKQFERVSTLAHALAPAEPCLKANPTHLTYDLRLTRKRA